MAKGSEARHLRELLPELATAIGCEQLGLGEQLSHAATGSRWLLESGRECFVATLDNPLAKSMGIDRDFQFRLLEQLEGLAIAPTPIYRDAAAGVTVVSYLCGEHPAAEFASDDNKLRALAGLLRELHATATDFAGGFPHTHFESRIESYVRIASSRKADELWRDIMSRMAEQRDWPAALCHNDAHTENILMADPLRLIDWDYAGVGPAWFDLASVIDGLSLNATAAQRFLDAYFGPETGGQHGEPGAWLAIRSRVEMLWELCVASQTQKRSDP
jgi:aminoglycoside phosphotransferase (APT) family kinase protein